MCPQTRHRYGVGLAAVSEIVDTLRTYCGISPGVSWIGAELKEALIYVGEKEALIYYLCCHYCVKNRLKVLIY